MSIQESAREGGAEAAGEVAAGPWRPRRWKLGWACALLALAGCGPSAVSEGCGPEIAVLDPSPSSQAVPAFDLGPVPLFQVRVQVLDARPAGVPDLTEAYLQTLFDQANEYFAPVRIRLVFDYERDVERTDDPAILNSTGYRALLDHGDRITGAMAVVFRDLNGLPNSGWTYENLVDVQRDVGVTKLVHELGHYFGLSHTFRTVYQAVAGQFELAHAVQPYPAVGVSGALTPQPGSSHDLGSPPTWIVLKGTRLSDGYEVTEDTTLPRLIRERVEARYGRDVCTYEALAYGFEVRDMAMDGDGLPDTPPDLGEILLERQCAGDGGGHWGWSRPPTLPLRVTYSSGVEIDYAFSPSTWNAMSYWDFGVGGPCGAKSPVTWGFSRSQAERMREWIQKEKYHLLGPALRWDGAFQPAGGGPLIEGGPALTSTWYSTGTQVRQRLFVFAQWLDGRIYWSAVDQGGTQVPASWRALPTGPVPLGGPAAFHDGLGRCWVYCTALDGRIWRTSSASGGDAWAAWTEVPGSGRSDGAPAAAYFSEEGAGYVLVKGPQPAAGAAAIYEHQHTDAGGDVGWFDLGGGGGTDAVPTVCAVDGLVHAYARTLSGTLVSCWKVAWNGFQPWVPVTGALDALLPFKAVSPPGAAPWNGAHVILAATSSADDLNVHFAAAASRGGFFRGWRRVPGAGQTLSRPAMHQLGTDLFLLVRGLDGVLRQTRARGF